MSEEEKDITKFFSNSYEYPGKYKHDLHAIYEPERNIYVLVQYTYLKNEEDLKELTMLMDNIHKADSENYRRMQEQGIVDENGNYVNDENGNVQKKSSLEEQVKKMKKKKNCGDKCDCE